MSLTISFRFAIWSLLLVMLTGCAGSKLAAQERTIAELHAENDSLRTRLDVLEDSLKFYDDIDSGQYHRDRRVLVDRIEELRYRLAVSREGGTTAATLLVDDLFAPASAELTNAGRQRLDELAARLAEEYPERSIRVEGHSDNVPIGPGLEEQYPSNWELSTARAAAVVRYLVDAHGLDADQLSAVGYGAARPAATNETPAGRKRNRRIRVAVLPPVTGS